MSAAATSVNPGETQTDGLPNLWEVFPLDPGVATAPTPVPPPVVEAPPAGVPRLPVSPGVTEFSDSPLVSPLSIALISAAFALIIGLVFVRRRREVVSADPPATPIPNRGQLAIALAAAAITIAVTAGFAFGLFG